MSGHKSRSFEQLVGERKQIWWNCQSERRCSVIRSPKRGRSVIRP
jgi:hypothetical protein